MKAIQKMKDMKLGRRQYLKAKLGLGVLLGVPKDVFAFSQGLFDKKAPIQTLGSLEYRSLDFNGDNADKPHEGLWNPEGVAERAGGWPQPSARHKVVIVGGGLSGLLSAYFLKQHRPVILELDKQFGGNSKGEEFEQTKFSIGAAYITVPEEGSSIDNFLKDLKLNQEYRHEGSDEVRYFMKKKLMADFMEGATDPSAKVQFQKLAEILQKNYEEAYPDIPWYPESALSYEDLKALDSVSFQDWLVAQLGDVHPHILEYFQLYAWSSFTASISEVSAAQMLNFVLSELDGVLAFPGGNAAITQRLYDDLKDHLPSSHLKSSALVIRVEVVADGVIVYYQDENNTLQAMHAEKVIMACQKFVAKRVCVNMPNDQREAIEKMLYRGYVVGNVIYDQKISSPGFDLYCYEGDMPEEPRAMKPSKRPFADFICADWASSDQGRSTILSVYRPLPFDGARQFLFSPMAHQKHLSVIEKGIQDYEQALGLDSKNRKGIRMTRWGHSLPVASVGFIAEGLSEIVNQPIDYKIFFANQDNWANPAFECSFAAVESVLEQIGSL